jgi:hypothetical protein
LRTADDKCGCERFGEGDGVAVGLGNVVDVEAEGLREGSEAGLERLGRLTSWSALMSTRPTSSGFPPYMPSSRSTSMITFVHWSYTDDTRP